MSEQRYQVVERLEAGGMAEVFIGQATSVEGFKKLVAIKRVLPHLAQNRNFIAMFLDEARLGARLNHANIVTVFDVGATDNTYFIVMEYVDGANLKSLAEANHARGRSFPAKEALYIAMETARGLSYAHELTDDYGQPLRIVHRDVSPPNVMISRRGEIKVMDFGLAKATTQLESTDPGVVKGKFGYLSPEAANGQEVDARADIFATGVVLWELLSGRRLFLGDTDYQTVKLVAEARIPELDYDGLALPGNFEHILMRALAKRPEDRYQTARDFADALADYLFDNRMRVTSSDVANLARDLIPKRAPKASPEDASAIGSLIHDELAGFVSLGNERNAPIAGSAPIDLAGSATGANPLGADDLGGAMAWPGTAPEAPAALSSSLADQLDTGSHRLPDVEAMQAQGAAGQAAQTPAEPPLRQSRKGSRAIIAAVALLLVAGAGFAVLRLF